MKNLQNKRILTISEAAAYSGYSKKIIKYWIDNRLINHECPLSHKKKQLVRIRVTDLEKFLDDYLVINCFDDDDKFCDYPSDGTSDDLPF